MKNYTRALGYGLISWIIPFLVSFLFFDMEHQKLIINELFFKSIMIVLSAVVGSYLLVKYLKFIKKDFVKKMLIAGLIIMTVNLILDLFILLPMSTMSLAGYYTKIGLRYWIVPIFAVALGSVKA